MTPENRRLAFEWAKANYPRESCGVCIVEKGREVFVQCQNISELDDQFILSPEDYAHAESRGEIIRIVHSHVNSRPIPSDADLVSCEATNLPWSIVSYPNGDWHDFAPTGYKAPLVGRNWAHGLLDCYSLVIDYYAQELHIKLPDFDREFEWWLKGHDLYARNYGKAGFYEVPQDLIQRHDLILIQFMSPVVNHGAIYLGNDLMLHHLHRRLSSRDVYGGFWKSNTVKVLRHKDL